MRRLCMCFGRVRRVGVAVSLGLVFSMVGCADPSSAQAPDAQPASQAPQAPLPARRSNVATPFITLSPSSVNVAPGARVLLTAKPGGGEAMLFTVDWHVQEGAAGGTVEGVATRQADGTYTATYSAPADAAGPYHVTASLREYPAAVATATITVVPRR